MNHNNRTMNNTTVKSRSTRKTKPTYTINRKTLDMQHAEHMSEIEQRQILITRTKREIEAAQEKLALASDIEDVVRSKDDVIDLKAKLVALNNQSSSIQYFADTAGILFRYYDIVEDSFSKKAPAPTTLVPLSVQKIAPDNSVKARSGGTSILDYFGGGQQQQQQQEKSKESKEVAVEEDDEDPQRGSLLDKYMEFTEPNHVKTAIISEQTSSCAHCGCQERMIMHNDGFMLCNSCHTIEYVIVDHDKPSYKDPPKEISYYAYKRLNHFNEWLNQIQGKETTDIPDEVFDKILLEIKKQKIENIANLTHASVKAILKKLKINKYYEHIPHIINRLNGIPMPHLSIELEEMLRNMFKLIQAPFLKYSPFLRKNFLSYSYVLHKFIQLLGYDEYLVNFPLLKSREKLHQQDQIWCKICSELNWEFIKSL